MAANDALALGRDAFGRGAWAEASRTLAEADARSPLGPEDLDRLATAAYLAGDEAASTEARSRAHAGFVEHGDPVRGARSAFWLAFSLVDKPAHHAQLSGWLARARRLIDECGRDCVERGLLLCLEAIQHGRTGDPRAAVAAFEEAAAIGVRFGDADLMALARHGQARGLIRMNRRADGFALLDETMVAVTSGEVSAMISGVVYCSLISACHESFDLRRAQEWTAALAAWCAAHPDVAAFRAQCLIRRSELMQLHGEWSEAAAEARRASESASRTPAAPEAGAAFYQQGELHRLQGDFARADEWYRLASQAGRKPFPGLALLRLAQGRTDAADAAVRGVLLETRDRRARARLLPACIEIMLAQQDVGSARAAADELAEIAREFDAAVLHAAAAFAAGTIAVAIGDAAGALRSLRQACAIRQELDAPYEVARARTALGLAYRQMGDEEGAQLELEAAQEVFDRLGAAPDAGRVAALLTSMVARGSDPLTGREVEVLRLVATGRTNRMIAAELHISEKTVARHLSNIFTKLDLPSRAAATAYAYEHKLV